MLSRVRPDTLTTVDERMNMPRLMISIVSLCLLCIASPIVHAGDCHPTPDCSEARMQQLGQAMRYALSNENTSAASAIMREVADCAWQKHRAQHAQGPSLR